MRALINRIYCSFEGLITPFPETEVVRPPSDLVGFFRLFLYPMRRMLAVLFVSSGLFAIGDLLLYVFVGILVDRLETADPATFVSQNSWMLLGMAFIVLIYRPIMFLITRGLINLTIAPGLSNLVRWQSYRYVLRQSVTFFQNDFAGRIAQKVLQSGPAVRECIANAVDGSWFLIIFLIGTFALLTEIDAILVLPLLVWTATYIATILYFVPRVRKKSVDVSETASALSGRIVDSYTNIQTVKLFSDPDREDAFVLTGFQRHIRAFQALMRAIIDVSFVLTLMNSALIFSIAALSIWLWGQGSVSLGALAMACGLAIRLNQSSGWVLRTITTLFENVGTAQNAIDTISRENRIQDNKTAQPIVVENGQIEFRNVHFNYEQEGRVIEDLCLNVAPGEKVGLVGRSGAGKSTLVNLLLRFHDVGSGEILIDSQNVNGVTQDSLRQAIGVVSQDTSLLHRSIRDNIAYGAEHAEDEEVIRAAQKAHAHEFISELADARGRRGYEAHVGERGVKLSGGQRQRIAIARVLLKNAPILVLDEATSALDSEVEAAIQEQLYNLIQGKTVIAIAHRLSTIAAMNRLIVMDNGRIVEEGTHEDLIKAGGVYAQLWERQSGGFLNPLAETGTQAAE
ncbi:MAG: ABC transporter ATP-binding protein [Stappiaceae bacterium]